MPTISKTTVRQIIDDIDIRYPNTYENEVKMLWINNSMKAIYKDIAVRDYYSFDTIKGQRLYVLPLDCSIDSIRSVEKSSNARINSNISYGDFKALKFSLPEQVMCKPSYYDGIANQIGLYPVPDENGYRINIYYNKKPQMVTNLDDYIELDDRYVDLVKYNTLSIIAMAGHSPDIDIANEYILLYNNLVNEANQSKYEDQQQYPKLRDELRPRLKYSRRR